MHTDPAVSKDMNGAPPHEIRLSRETAEVAKQPCLMNVSGARRSCNYKYEQLSLMNGGFALVLSVREM